MQDLWKRVAMVILVLGVVLFGATPTMAAAPRHLPAELRKVTKEQVAPIYLNRLYDAEDGSDGTKTVGKPTPVGTTKVISAKTRAAGGSTFLIKKGKGSINLDKFRLMNWKLLKGDGVKPPLYQMIDAGSQTASVKALRTGEELDGYEVGATWLVPIDGTDAGDVELAVVSLHQRMVQKVGKDKKPIFVAELNERGQIIIDELPESSFTVPFYWAGKISEPTDKSTYTVRYGDTLRLHVTSNVPVTVLRHGTALAANLDGTYTIADCTQDMEQLMVQGPDKGGVMAQSIVTIHVTDQDKPISPKTIVDVEYSNVTPVDMTEPMFNKNQVTSRVLAPVGRLGATKLYVGLFGNGTSTPGASTDAPLGPNLGNKQAGGGLIVGMGLFENGLFTLRVGPLFVHGDVPPTLAERAIVLGARLETGDMAIGPLLVCTDLNLETNFGSLVGEAKMEARYKFAEFFSAGLYTGCSARQDLIGQEGQAFSALFLPKFGLATRTSLWNDAEGHRADLSANGGVAVSPIAGQPLNAFVNVGAHLKL